MAELAPQDVVSWYKVITDFPSYWENFNTNFNALLAQRPYISEKHPELLDEYNKQVNDGLKLYSQLNQVKSAKDSLQNVFRSAGTTVESWLSSAQGAASSGWDSVKGWIGLSGLGILPIIWAGMAAGTAAGILYGVGVWLSNVQALATRLNRIKELEAKGLSSSQATTQVNGELGKPDTTTKIFGIPVWLITVGIISIFVAPPLLNYLTSRRRK